MSIREEVQLRHRFRQRYRDAMVDARVTTELEALGTDYGATGYTGRSQAERLVGPLGLEPGRRLLDLGAGCGWPGLFLAGRSGCDVVLTDLTVVGMQRGLRRAAREGMSGRTSAVVSSARRMPFRPESFDAIVHVDVLC